jgi:hypothetical protein
MGYLVLSNVKEGKWDSGARQELKPQKTRALRCVASNFNFWLRPIKRQAPPPWVTAHLLQ